MNADWTDPVALNAAADRLRDMVATGGWVDVENAPEAAVTDLLLIARDWFCRRSQENDQIRSLVAACRRLMESGCSGGSDFGEQVWDAACAQAEAVIAKLEE